MKDPLKQGLKLDSVDEIQDFSIVEVKDPLKQGLKRGGSGTKEDPYLS